MSEQKSNVPWPVWAAVSIIVVFIPAYFTYKASVEKPAYVPPETVVKVPAKTEEELQTEKKVNRSVEPASTSDAPINKDEEMSRKLVGNWNDNSSANGFNFDATMTYNSNGKFTGETNVSSQMGFVGTVYYSGNWEINNGYCTLTVTGSNDVRYIPVGTMVKCKIRSINDEEYIYTDQTGVRRSAQRMN